VGRGRQLRRRTEGGARLRPATAWLDVAVLVWGTAYLIAALDTPSSAARLLDLNVVGSVDPPAALLEWVALGAAFAALGFWASRRVPRHWINPAVSLAAVAALAVIGEGAARLRAVIAPSTQGFWTYSGQLWTRRFVRLNHLGFRDREHDLVRPAGTRRLALPGAQRSLPSSRWGVLVSSPLRGQCARAPAPVGPRALRREGGVGWRAGGYRPVRSYGERPARPAAPLRRLRGAGDGRRPPNLARRPGVRLAPPVRFDGQPPGRAPQSAGQPARRRGSGAGTARSAARRTGRAGAARCGAAYQRTAALAHVNPDPNAV